MPIFKLHNRMFKKNFYICNNKQTKLTPTKITKDSNMLIQN